MKKLLSLFIMSLICEYNIYAQQGYWFQNHFIVLEPDNSSQYYVQLVGEDIPKGDNTSIVKNLIKSENVFSISPDGFMIKATERPANKKLYVSDLYHSSISDCVIILPSISFEMNSGCSASNILKKYSNILTLKAIEGNVYRLRCNLLTSKEILKISSQIYQEGNVKWCEPVKISSWHSYNPKYSQQYYLKNTGQGNGQAGIDINVEPAWDLVTGNSNITVAVIDEGIDLYHEDMTNCILNGYTIGNPTGYGAPQATNIYEKGHGVACAGIIGAEDNSTGIKGVACGVHLLPVNIVPNSGYYDYLGILHQGFANDEEIAKAIVWASSRADVLSCSWGGGNYSQDIVNAIDTARIFGRNGKGCVVVFATGNDYNNGKHYVNFPASINGVLAVGAINNVGTIWDYSQRGNEIDLVAPSGNGNSTSDIVTTDRMGNLGYQTSGDWNYYEHFGGTSAACPQVAGVAALMLSANPSLTESLVRAILQQTATDLGNAGFDTTYGYGLVNACAAVLKAYLNLSGSYHVCSTETYTIQNLPSGATVQWSASNSKLCLVSGQGTGTATFQKVSNGACTITAQVTLGTTTVSFTKDVWAGTPTQPSISGWPNNNQFLPRTSYQFDATGDSEAQILEYQWCVVSGATITSGGNTNSATFKMNNSGSVKIGVRARNACGWGPYKYKMGMIQDDAPINSPGNNIVSIPLSGDGEYEIQLWNTNRMIRSTKTTKSSYDVDLNNLPSDLYIIKVLKDGQNFNQMKVKKQNR